MDKNVSLSEKIFVSIIFSIVGAVIGLISRAVYGPVTLLPLSALAIDVGPWILVVGIMLGILGYMYPRKASWLLCLLPVGCEIS